MKMRQGQILLGLALLLGACGSGEKAEEGMEGMKGMDSAGGMQGMAMPGMQMMPMMRAHMDSMMGRSPAEMQNMMARHQEMMSQMLDGMGTDMRGMNLTGDSAWTALTDSVKRDLAELPGLEGQALQERMRSHNERVGRLLAMHERMMRR
jgi:hypothetical protein